MMKILLFLISLTLHINLALVTYQLIDISKIDYVVDLITSAINDLQQPEPEVQYTPDAQNDEEGTTDAWLDTSYAHFQIVNVLDVPIYSVDPEYWQYIVDLPDAAADIRHPDGGGSRLLADHSNQAFQHLFDTQIGCYAYLVEYDGTVHTYICVSITYGYDIDAGLPLDTGQDAYTEYVADLVCYTCDPTYEYPNRRFVVLFNEIF